MKASSAYANIAFGPAIPVMTASWMRRQGRRGIVLGNLGDAADAKHVLGEVAELAGREHVAGQLAMDALRVGPLDPDGRRAAGGGAHEEREGQKRHGPVAAKENDLAPRLR